MPRDVHINHHRLQQDSLLRTGRCLHDCDHGERRRPAWSNRHETGDGRRLRPIGGFVTGGGWIQSPAGAYCEPRARGQGELRVRLQVPEGREDADRTDRVPVQGWRSQLPPDAYQWLVVAGAKAQYKGTGRLNGVPGYGFVLTATDGQSRRRRGRQIPDQDHDARGAVVYDNIPASDDIDRAASRTSRPAAS